MSVAGTLFRFIDRMLPIGVADAHCDIPCGIYDPHDALQAADTVIKMQTLIKDLETKGIKTAQDQMQIARYTETKEEHAQKAKHETLVLWTDYFKPEHLQKHPKLHELAWNAAKAASTAKRSADPKTGQDLKAAIEKIADIFHETKKA